MSFKGWLNAKTACRIRLGQMIRDWVRAWECRDASGVTFWAQEIRDLNDAMIELDALYPAGNPTGPAYFEAYSEVAA